jgi:hypothetical protein
MAFGTASSTESRPNKVMATADFNLMQSHFCEKKAAKQSPERDWSSELLIRSIASIVIDQN